MKKWILVGVLALTSSWLPVSAYAVTTKSVAKPPEATTSQVRPATTRVNINTADAQALAQGLVGVGPAKAAAIVAWRKQNGPFKSVVALAEVKGIGPALLERNKDRLSIR